MGPRLSVISACKLLADLHKHRESGITTFAPEEVIFPPGRSRNCPGISIPSKLILQVGLDIAMLWPMTLMSFFARGQLTEGWQAQHCRLNTTSFSVLTALGRGSVGECHAPQNPSQPARLHSVPVMGTSQTATVERLNWSGRAYLQSNAIKHSITDSMSHRAIRLLRGLPYQITSVV
jgi:hypothetical protein